MLGDPLVVTHYIQGTTHTPTDDHIRNRERCTLIQNTMTTGPILLLAEVPLMDVIIPLQYAAAIMMSITLPKTIGNRNITLVKFTAHLKVTMDSPLLITATMPSKAGLLLSLQARPQVPLQEAFLIIQRRMRCTREMIEVFWTT